MRLLRLNHIELLRYAGLFTYACVPITFELQDGSWVSAGAIGVMSRLQWKYYKKYV